MGWFWLLVAALFICLLIIPFKEWKVLWIAGIISIFILLVIDSTLISLGAFYYTHIGIAIDGLSIFYLASGFFGGCILVHFYPRKKIMKFPFIVFSTLIFLSLELIMHLFNYMIYINWSPLKSFFLDILGFIVVVWTYEYFRSLIKKLKKKKY